MNIIGTETMKTLIWNNNQYLKSVATIPINGIPPQALTTKIIIDKEADKPDQTKMTVKEYLLSANWCHGLEPTDQEGQYLLTTMTQQLTEAHKWLDKNLEAMFTNHIPCDGNYTPIEGYEYPKHADKPWFSTQFGTYADQLWTLYPAAPTNDQTNLTQWKKSPLKHQQCMNITKDFVFNKDKHPALQDMRTKRNNTGDNTKTKEPNQPPIKPNSTSASAKEICKQILADMKQDISCIISSEIATICTEITDKLTELHSTINSEVKQQIAEVLQTIQTLNQHFTEVLNCLPPTPSMTPSHKKSKGLGIQE